MDTAGNGGTPNDSADEPRDSGAEPESTPGAESGSTPTGGGLPHGSGEYAMPAGSDTGDGAATGPSGENGSGPDGAAPPYSSGAHPEPTGAQPYSPYADPNAFTGAPARGGFAPPTGFAPHGSGQFQAPAGDQYQVPASAQFAQPPGMGQFAAPSGQFSDHGMNPQPGQFEPNQGGFSAPGADHFAPGGPLSAPGSSQSGPGQYPGGPADSGFYGPASGQFAQSSPSNAQSGGPAESGGYQSEPAHPAPASAPESEPPGGPIYSWAPPPIPAAPATPPQPAAPAQPPGAPDQYGPATGQYPPQGSWGQQPEPPRQQAPGQGYPQQQQQEQFQPRHINEPGQPGYSVNDLNLLKRARKAPRSGWRRAVHKVSRGVINPGESAADIVHSELVARVNAPVHGDFRIAILSLKGGVGKTTTTVGLGSTFASLRGDRVIAIDANPDLGTLAHRVPRQTRSTVRNLLEDQNITRYSDVRAHTSQAPSRLEVLASEQDPAVSEAFSEADYRRAIGILQSFYNIILTDCGTGLMHSAMSGVLDMASSLVLVTSPAIDGARSASATLDWLDHHGYSQLVRQTVVVVNASRRGSSSVNLDHLRKLFLDRTRAVQVVPFDDHLAEGAEIDLELVSKPTRQALLELAAMVADDFASVPGYPYQNPY